MRPLNEIGSLGVFLAMSVSRSSRSADEGGTQLSLELEAPGPSGGDGEGERTSASSGRGPRNLSRTTSSAIAMQS
eukprot:3308891-Alexandrium_andersonii.AAC.1